MRVFVKNMRGEPLMPCKPQKARKLLKAKKAKIISYKPFTIQLTIATGETKQDVDIGVDTGSSHIGICVRSKNNVFAKGEITLRNDVKFLLETRRILRRDRRNRKTRYREVRFLNRKKPDGWLPPSIQSKINNEFMWIDRFCTGGCYIQDIQGTYITIDNKNYKQVTISRCKLINKNNNWRFAPSVSPN